MRMHREVFVGGLVAAAILGWFVGQTTHESREESARPLASLFEAIAGTPVSAAADPAQSPRRVPAPARGVIINHEMISDDRVAALEATYRVKILSGRYWYDKATGAWGYEGGPTVGLVLPGLAIGGPLAANASNGTTGVFINGRELHILDVRALMQIVQVQRGRFWMDAFGNFGRERGPIMGNIVALANAAGGGVRRQGILSTYDKVGAVVIGGQ